jgi:hypothetical protein
MRQSGGGGEDHRGERHQAQLVRMRLDLGTCKSYNSPSRPFATSQLTMRPTAACLAPGFVKRSLDEFKRLSNYGMLCTTLPLQQCKRQN